MNQFTVVLDVYEIYVVAGFVDWCV